MDPETAKLIVPGLFALGGTVIGGTVSYFVARANMAAQRAIARDNAVRENRARQAQGLRERFSEHRVRFNLLGTLTYEGLQLAVDRALRESTEEPGDT